MGSVLRDSGRREVVDNYTFDGRKGKTDKAPSLNLAPEGRGVGSVLRDSGRREAVDSFTFDGRKDGPDKAPSPNLSPEGRGVGSVLRWEACGNRNGMCQSH